MDPRAGGELRGGQSAFFALAADRLKSWVRHQLWMAEDLGGGVTRRAVYQKAGRAKPGAAAQLPACLQHVSNWWLALLPFYGRREIPGAIPPSQLAMDVETRFGMLPNMFEINLLQDLFEMSLKCMDAGLKERK
ncbi:hypothetical protein NBZ79_12170 [Sneathiella marina]|uniref:Uncharacterized protein n=1 Tax=Sneathiella marina TaxID=2950108 RepID=A0ABY4VZ23_9PROT|nr:hypothetical protein [Sneathiella marina]USG59932.1 hypothetical protein NBZ79_12170 [Sneathiella marina]